ncbi:alpha/beta hydrolase family protein [Larkinella bovis]|uniref:Alpha/beta hydrolase family protein n=1 Tax=Larkinella bovis TaxID=683041 RepID=A0ABW0I3X7_9BACT
MQPIPSRSRFRSSFVPLKTALVALFLTVYLASCTLVDHQPAPSYLVSSSLVAEVPVDQLAPRLAALNLPAQIPAQTFLLYNIKVYKLVYNTKAPNGQPIRASGALIVPQAPPSVGLPMISQQHGTIFTNNDAPSNYAMTSEAYVAASVFASNGYIMACPDYIGFGESGDPSNPLNLLLHTYEHREGLAQASLDMLRAAKEFIQNNSINWDTRLYLTGYSEGGYATMALYKKMQDEVPAEFNLKAVTAGAGAYDKTAFTKSLLSTPSHGIANYNRTYLWVLMTYDKLYGLNRSPGSYFVDPYLGQIVSQSLAVNLTVSFDQIFTTSFKAGVANGTDTNFLNALADNDVFDWKPLKPLQLYHGTDDPQVFFLNSQNAYMAMQARGAGSTVQLVPIPTGNHQTSLPYYILGTYTFIKANP